MNVTRVFALAAIGSIPLVSQLQAQTPLFDDNDIAGVVSSAAGPEAGVWVIAETDELGTRFARIVVTDDAGRFVIPDLPDAG